MQLDISTIITIGGATLGLLATLVKMIRDNDMKRLEACETQLAALHDRQKDILAIIAVLQQNVGENNRRLDLVNQDVSYAIKKLEDQREHLADIRETIAGFGATYVTRRDFNERQQRQK